MAEHEDDLERLAPRSMIVGAGGETLEVFPLTIGQLPAISKALKGIDFDVNNLDVISLIADHGDSVVNAVATAISPCFEEHPRINEPAQIKAWLNRLSLDQFAELATVVLEVNADFFARRVLPSMQRAVERMTATAGRIASNNSLNPGTAGATSKPTR